jgi:hypothetical protein
MVMQKRDGYLHEETHAADDTTNNPNADGFGQKDEEMFHNPARIQGL